MLPVRRLTRHERIPVLVGIIVLFALVMPHHVGAGEDAGKGVKPGQGGKAGMLADRHKAAGLECSACHKPSAQKAPPTEVCLGCHGPYENLAGKTEKLEPNPHASHQGEMECGDCHHGHKPSEDACGRCHTFGFKVP